MPKFHFTVRETTEREAIVTAKSHKEARAMLKQWAQPGQPGNLAEDGGPIVLGDMDTVKITAMPIKAR